MVAFKARGALLGVHAWHQRGGYPSIRLALPKRSVTPNGTLQSTKRTCARTPHTSDTSINVSFTQALRHWHGSLQSTKRISGPTLFLFQGRQPKHHVAVTQAPCHTKWYTAKHEDTRHEGKRCKAKQFNISDTQEKRPIYPSALSLAW